MQKGGASWLLRFMLNGRRRDMGLGSVKVVGLAQARELAMQHLHALKATRIDPIARRLEQRAEAGSSITFDKAAADYIAEHEASWRNPKHRAQWRSTLSTYASPKIGTLPVADVTTDHLMAILKPLWRRIPETASRLRGRIRVILDFAKARGYRAGENPARWRGHVQHQLPAVAKLKVTRHHAAVPVDQLSAVYRKLAQSGDVAAAAVRFCILTAARPGEVTGMTWDEVDMATNTWTVPPHRQKARKPHRVPLNGEALKVLEQMAALRSGPHGLVFPGARKGRPLSVATLAKLLPMAGGGRATVHWHVAIDVRRLGQRTHQPSVETDRPGAGARAEVGDDRGLSPIRLARTASAVDGRLVGIFVWQVKQ